jgi:hypothetical protein
MSIPGNNFNERNEQIDTKSNQWFGATVSSAGVDGPLVVSVVSNKIINFIVSLRCGDELFNFHNSFNVNSVCLAQFLLESISATYSHVDINFPLPAVPFFQSNLNGAHTHMVRCACVYRY